MRTQGQEPQSNPKGDHQETKPKTNVAPNALLQRMDPMTSQATLTNTPNDKRALAALKPNSHTAGPTTTLGHGNTFNLPLTFHTSPAKTAKMIFITSQRDKPDTNGNGHYQTLWGPPSTSGSSGGL